MEDIVVPVLVCGFLFLGLPWLVFHYITKWKQAGSLSVEDENLMDDLYETARRLEDRLGTIERIIAADDPTYRPAAAARIDREPVDPRRDEPDPGRIARDRIRR